MYIIEKYYRGTDKVIEFEVSTKEEAKRIFFNFCHSAKTDMYNYPIEECFNLGHASFTDFYLVVINKITMYDEIREQIPNPYYPNELYPVFYKSFSQKAKYFATVNNRGFLHIYKITVKGKILILERFRFTKQKKLVFMNEYILTEKDEDVYAKYKNIVDNTKTL